jgi:hypothetical protein
VSSLVALPLKQNTEVFLEESCLAKMPEQQQSWIWNRFIVVLTNDVCVSTLPALAAKYRHGRTIPLSAVEGVRSFHVPRIDHLITFYHKLEGNEIKTPARIPIKSVLKNSSHISCSFMSWVQPRHLYLLLETSCARRTSEVFVL